jgi:predicted transposase/invertase (TIGR01784 family)
MERKRLKPLNDFAFQKVMGEKGDERQLLAFLNAVLSRTGKGNLTEVEILEDKDLPAETVGGKGGRLDVLARLADGSRVNIEVQLKNEHNLEKRSLFYWSSAYIKGFRSGGDYQELLPVIAINITGFRELPAGGYHTSFHLREDEERDHVLTDVCEIHFLDMVKFRRRAGVRLEEPLERWLAWMDDKSGKEVIEEVIGMDEAIGLAESKLEQIARDPEMLRAYERYEKQASDWTSSINGARREGIKEVAQNLKEMGEPVEKITRATGLSREIVESL